MPQDAALFGHTVGGRTITLILTPRAVSKLDESHWHPDSRFGIPELDKVLEKYQCKNIRYLLPEEHRTRVEPVTRLERTFVLLFEPGIIIDDVRRELLMTPDVEHAAPPKGYFLEKSPR